METIIKLAWYDKVTERLIDEKVITHLFTEKELRTLLGEKEELYACYPLISEKQRQYIEKRLLITFSEDYDYFIEISGDWVLDMREAVWIPAGPSGFTDKQPIDRKDAEQAFVSSDPEKILDALIRITFYDPDYHWIEEKCLDCLASNNLTLQREAIICIGHLARIHGKINTSLVVPKLKQLKTNPDLSEVAEDALYDIECYLNVKRRKS